MPVISAFFGIVIRMYYREHDPPHSTPSTKAITRRSVLTARWWVGASGRPPPGDASNSGQRCIGASCRRIGPAWRQVILLSGLSRCS